MKEVKKKKRNEAKSKKNKLQIKDRNKKGKIGRNIRKDTKRQKIKTHF
jgi:hypothetical protein